MTVRVGMGFDIHPFGGEQPLVLGGVEIEGPGLVGHSDADVVVHAVADALLGAACLDDLGTLFPASDDRHKGASSIDMLEEVARRLADSGWSVGNVDVVVAAETPPLAAHRALMCERIAGALAAAEAPHQPAPFVNLKPKRGEGLGAVGRSEGIAAWAVCLLVRGE